MIKNITHHIDLSQAANEIREAVLDTWADKAESPFLFLIGAGVSWPNIPLARDMVEHCQEKAKKKRTTKNPASSDDYTCFHHWLNRAYPQLGQRRRYLASLVQDTAISEANF